MANWVIKSAFSFISQTYHLNVQAPIASGQKSYCKWRHLAISSNTKKINCILVVASYHVRCWPLGAVLGSFLRTLMDRGSCIGLTSNPLICGQPALHHQLQLHRVLLQKYFEQKMLDSILQKGHITLLFPYHSAAGAGYEFSWFNLQLLLFHSQWIRRGKALWHKLGGI